MRSRSGRPSWSCAGTGRDRTRRAWAGPFVPLLVLGSLCAPGRRILNLRPFGALGSSTRAFSPRASFDTAAPPRRSRHDGRPVASGSPKDGSVSERVASTVRTFGRRLTWRGLEPSAVREDRVTMARTFIYLFGAGATLVLVSMLFPHSPDRDTAGLLITALAAYLVAAGFLLVFDRLPMWAFEVAPFAGTVLVSLAVYFGGSQAETAYAMFYFWVAVAACYLLRPAIAFAHLILASAAYGLVLLVGPGHVALPGLKWGMVTGTLAVLGILMIALRGQVERLVSQLAAAARTDSLTQLANRRELEERFASELERSTRTARPLSILILDL